MKTIVAGILGFASLGVLGGVSGCGNECSDAAEKMRTCCAKEPDPAIKSLCERVATALEDTGEDCDADHVTCDAE